MGLLGLLWAAGLWVSHLVTGVSSKRESDLVFPLFQSLLQEAESKSELTQNISAREHFVFTDNDGQVYHLTVEGNCVRDSARIPPDVSLTLNSSGARGAFSPALQMPAFHIQVPAPWAAVAMAQPMGILSPGWQAWARSWHLAWTWPSAV